MKKISNIEVVGFGHIGSGIGAVLADNGHSIYGIDQNKKLMSSFTNGDDPISEPHLQQLVSKGIRLKKLKLTSDFNVIEKVDSIIITVGTPLNDQYKADLSNLIDCCSKIEPFLRDNQLILLKSTVPPGTTREIVNKLLCKEKFVDVVFSPERLAEGNAISELQQLPIVVGGISEKGSARGSLFLETDAECTDN